MFTLRHHQHRHRQLLSLFLLALTLACSRVHAMAEPGGLDLANWDTLLGAAVKDGQVDYGQWQDNPDFDALVQQVAEADTSGLSRTELLSFYINAYNILAAEGILSGQSPSSLLGRYTYFMRTRYVIAGESMNLYDFEHERIRPLQEPRIHFAIVCASHSCPKLRSEAYTPEMLDKQLQDAALGFINDPSRNVFDTSTGKANLSKIFKWFEEDFEAAGSLQAYLADFVEDEATAEKLRSDGFRIRHAKYHWHLNGSLE